MSGSGLQVRCLSSTRVSKRTWQDQQPKETDEHDTQSNSNKANEGSYAQTNGQSQDLENGFTLKSKEKDSEDDPTTSKSPSRSPSGSDVGTESDDESDSTSSCNTDDQCTSKSTSEPNKRHISCVQEAQLSPDGTCIFTSDYNRSFSVYAIDVESHEETNTRSLEPYAQFTSSDPIWAFAANPLFDANDPNSTHVLVSRRDRYITLHNALWDVSQPDQTSASAPTDPPLDICTPIASYKLINHLTEAVTAPLSLTYSHTRTHFFAGARNTIHIFDLSCPDDPIHSIPTIPSARSKLKGGGRGFKGWISALTSSQPSTFAQEGLLTAGARTRHIGIYDAHSGSEISTFSLPGTLDGRKLSHANMQHIIGDGVSSLKYSPCGTYLYVAERNSDVLLIYDVRNFSLSLAYCAGRKALTKQKLGFDVWNAGASPYDIEGTSHEIWAGGTDGVVRVWRDPYVKEGAVEADEVSKVGEGDAPVVGTMVHPSGGMAVATCGRIEVGEDRQEGRERGGAHLPKFREWGSVDILGLN